MVELRPSVISGELPMSSSTMNQRDAVVATAIQEISHIATLPEITLKIIDLVEDPTSTAQDLHQVITNDPALCSRILKVVNSSFYGLPGQIGSINRAIVLLGLNAVKNIAIATSLTKLFRAGDLSEHFSARDLWTNATGLAAASKLIADKVGIGLADEAFLAGLLANIGIMVEMQATREKLALVVEGHRQGEKSFVELEEEYIGATHEDFGRALCEKWKFPKSFGFVTGFRHKPLELPPENRTLACVVHVADRMAKKLSIGYTGMVEGDTPDPAVLEEIRLSAEDLDAILEELPESVEQVQTVLG